MPPFIAKTLVSLEHKGLKRILRHLHGAQGPRVLIEGKNVLNFCSNNYLGLADDVRLKEAAIESMEREGFGSGASRLICGNLPSHRRLEEKCAQFKGTERCMVYSTGYMANVGIISSLMDRDSIVFSDRLNHASIIDGIVLSQAKIKRYPHCDTEALRQMLKDNQDYKKKIIVTDGVFSMDGDIAPLDRIVELARQYDCMVMVDEAHALGVLGKKSKGVVEHFGLEGKIDIQMGTFSKAVGSFGAYCCGSEDLIDFLINRARSFIYTTGMPPSVAAASLKGLEIIEEEPQRRQRLLDNAYFLRAGLQEMGFDTLNSQTPIIPVVVKDPQVAVEFSKRLFDKGILISAIRPPTVPVNTARLRVTVMATHTQDDLVFTLQCFKEIGEQLCLL